MESLLRERMRSSLRITLACLAISVASDARAQSDTGVRRPGQEPLPAEVPAGEPEPAPELVLPPIPPPARPGLGSGLRVRVEAYRFEGNTAFTDPELEQVKEAHKVDARAVELNTAAWSEAANDRAREAALRKLTDSARLGRKLGLAVHAGHGLDYQNVGPIAAMSELAELNIGHAIVARAVLVGMERAVREMADAMRAGRTARV